MAGILSLQKAELDFDLRISPPVRAQDRTALLHLAKG